ncbi:metallophosphoesterase [Frigoribacterium sp. PhB116]|uniref:metallophosphoesterase family protein n=1 Tax=Frigoribacterium sp. PhB116 TaxID=2485174 RepID=UPI0014150269|nr:metallophosphoesterase [Frigoribacterium sp. PhB116]
MPLRILHVSDIHFNDNGWDDDLDQRTELVRDVASYVEANGKLDAILVGGDIAFGAEAIQYRVARAWIDELLVAAGGLGASDVWVVPGNHDVSWDVIRKSPIAQDFRQALSSCEVQDIDLVLQTRLARDPNAAAVLAPLDAYNDFAASFGCAVTAEAPMWSDDTLEVDGTVLRLTGMNSAITSYNDTADPATLNLVVGTHQARLDREPELIHLVMMHHPPDWLRDWDAIAPYLKRAHVVLFGHEHAYSSRQPDGVGATVHVNAGAVAPERQAGGEHDPFLACYNVLTLAKADGGIDVLVQPRYWNKLTTRFAGHPAGDEQYFVADDPAGGALPPPTFDDSEVDEDPIAASPLVEESGGAPLEILPREARKDLRRIAVAFLQLPVTRRREIGRRLQVLDDEDLSIPDRELWNIVLKRIRTQELIERLEEEL